MVSNPERAKTLGLGYDEWRWVMFEGCMADNENMNVYAKILAEWMGGNGNVKITTPHGTNFSLAFLARAFAHSWTLGSLATQSLTTALRMSGPSRSPGAETTPVLEFTSTVTTVCLISGSVGNRHRRR